MDPFLLIWLSLVLSLYVARWTTVLLHELGHAIPAILFTRKRVAIYLGTYGTAPGMLKISVGLLDAWISYNPFKWRRGICIPSDALITIRQEIILTLTGPLTSFLLAVIASWFVFFFDLHGFLKLVAIILLMSSVFDMIVNLVPRFRPVMLSDGTRIYNDGRTLVKLFGYRKLSETYNHGIVMYRQERYLEAAKAFKTFLDSGFKEDRFYRLTVISLLLAKDFDGAKEVLDNFRMKDRMNADDLVYAGVIYSNHALYAEALSFFDGALSLDSSNVFALGNKAHLLSLTHQFGQALALFDEILKTSDTWAFALSGRGLALIKTGNPEAGLRDIEAALRLDDREALAYVNMGIYHLDRGEYLQALKRFERAEELGGVTRQTTELIASVSAKLK